MQSQYVGEHWTPKSAVRCQSCKVSEQMRICFRFENGVCGCSPHHSPIPGKTDKADVVEDGYSLFLIFKNKPSLFQYVYLFSEGDGLLCIFHIKRNVPPWSAGLATRSVVGFVGAKVRLLFGIAKLFQRKVNFPLVFSRFSESTSKHKGTVPLWGS